MDYDVWQELEEFKRSGQVSFSIEFQPDDTVFVSMTRKVGDNEHYFGAYFETVEEGMTACMKAITNLSIKQRAAHLEVVK